MSITENAKGQALLTALQMGFAKAAELGAAAEGDDLHRVTPHPGLPGAPPVPARIRGPVVLFNGTNSDHEFQGDLPRVERSHAGDRP